MNLSTALIGDHSHSVPAIPAEKVFILNPNPESGARGLLVGFSAGNVLVGLKTVADPKLGFTLSREAAFQLGHLLLAELTAEAIPAAIDIEFKLAT